MHLRRTGRSACAPLLGPCTVDPSDRDRSTLSERGAWGNP
jgi:hypothetical protein